MIWPQYKSKYCKERILRIFKNIVDICMNKNIFFWILKKYKRSNIQKQVLARWTYFLILCGHYKSFILSFVPKKIWWENICLRLNKSSYILISLVKHKSNCSLSDLSPIILLFEEQSFQFLDSFYCLHLPTRNTVKCIIWIVFYFKLSKVEFALS